MPLGTTPGVSSRLQGSRISWSCNLGENMSVDSFDPVTFKNGLQTLVTGLKNTSNPNIFVTSFIIGANPAIDDIKRQVCAEDPSHRFFVNLSGVDCSGLAGHPNDAGMKTIADTLFSSMVAHSAPEPSSLALLSIAGLLLAAGMWRRRSRRLPVR